jgi:SAM-dependent methyltransferase
LAHIVGDYECYGVEWNAEEAAHVRDIGEVACDEGEFIDAFPDKKFTAIVARQVFEHVTDPTAFLKQARDRLIGGGWLFMELPNANTALNAVYDIPTFRDWFYQAPHITYWEPETLANLLSAHGFEARVQPLQRWGLMQAASWLLSNIGMPTSNSPLFSGNLTPVRSNHPLAPALNRIWQRLDIEYRTQMQTLGCNDQMRVLARRLEI